MQPQQPFTILVVDDEPPICDVLTKVSRTLFPEARFINTRSAEETLAYLEEISACTPRLILLDIDLNQSINGLELLPTLRSRSRGLTPIIMFSVSAEQPTVEQAYTQGAIAYTQKPDDLAGWQAYVKNLRAYWYVMSRLPEPPAP